MRPRDYHWPDGRLATRDHIRALCNDFVRRLGYSDQVCGWRSTPTGLVPSSLLRVVQARQNLSHRAALHACRRFYLSYFFRFSLRQGSSYAGRLSLVLACAIKGD